VPPYAICASDKCTYLFDWCEDKENLPSRIPPELCPCCGGKTIFYCSTCLWSLLEVPDEAYPTCGNCSAKLRLGRRSYLELHVNRKHVRVRLRSLEGKNNACRSTEIVLGSPPKPCPQILDLNSANRNSYTDPEIHCTACPHRRPV
jgi:hypothetical protein